MKIKLTFTNLLRVPVVLRSNRAMGEQIEPDEALETTFEVSDDPGVISEIVLICEPVEEP